MGVMLMYQPPLMLDRISIGTMKSSIVAQSKVPISIKGKPASEHRRAPMRRIDTLPNHFFSTSIPASNGAITLRINMDMLVLWKECSMITSVKLRYCMKYCMSSTYGRLE